MRRLVDRLKIAQKAFFQLGPGEVSRYALYRFGLMTGHYRRLTPLGQAVPYSKPSRWWLENLFQPKERALSEVMGEEGRIHLMDEAAEILSGQVRLFSGAECFPLNRVIESPVVHWTDHKAISNWIKGQDIKYFWEPARLGWVFPLARAYRLTGDERYPQFFWEWIETFWQANPPNQGQHWSSAQEVAIRIIGMAFAANVFRGTASSTDVRNEKIIEMIAAHARRIPPTLVYARAQNNNHLLSEAAGLLTAGVMLEGPEAENWRKSGWKWAVWCFENQIHLDGTYVQHSTNYHRLMLQLAMWITRIGDVHGLQLTELARQRLSAATSWLAGQVDPFSGEMCNLGANDGANPFPLADGKFRDVRPTLQAAARMFNGGPVFPPGPWDEMSLWFCDSSLELVHVSSIKSEALSGKGRFEHPRGDSWAVLRAVDFKERPSHADQLNLDLWWRGLNITLDPGTYLYNAQPPWDNRLAGTAFHNTVCINGQDQMLYAGRFLWLDWAQGSWIDENTAQHFGYSPLGIRHERQVVPGNQPDWLIRDRLVQNRKKAKSYSIQLHWLFPDWEWTVDGMSFMLKSPYGWIRIHFSGPNSDHAKMQVERAGEVLYGDKNVRPQSGWYSWTYGVKTPALAVRLDWPADLPAEVITAIDFPMV